MMDAKEKRLQQLVAKVQKNQKAFLESAKAIYEIARDGLHGSISLAKLCENEFDFSMNDTTRYKDAGCVLEKLSDFSVLPINEAQCRVLARLDSVDVVDTWQRVIDSGKKITAALIADYAPQDESPHASTSKPMSEWLNDKLPVVIGDDDKDEYEDVVDEVVDEDESVCDLQGLVIAAIENLELLACADLESCEVSLITDLFGTMKVVREISERLFDRLEAIEAGSSTLALPLGHVSSVNIPNEVPV